ncbi:MAG: hypothetical protein J5517_06495 [Eubacterium sp.]|nr:hypothetical protein [Eubacterium sp.]
MILDKGYQTHTSYHCLIGCVENYCIYKSIPVTGADIFFYIKGFMLKYKKREDDGFNLFSYLDYINGLPELGIDFPHEIIGGNNSEVKNKLISLVENEQMIMLKMDTSKIQYDIIFSRNEQTFHSFNVIAYDYENDSFCISDSFIPAYEPFSKQLWISSEELLNAWENCRELWTVRFNNEINYMDLFTKDKIIEQLEWYLKGGMNEEYCFGLSSIRKLILDFEKSILDGWDIQRVIDLNFQLRVNGFYMGREYLASFLNQITEEELFNELMEIINHWKRIGMSLTKCVMRKKEDKFIQRIQEMNSLCDAEEQVFKKIIRILKENV